MAAIAALLYLRHRRRKSDPAKSRTAFTRLTQWPPCRSSLYDVCRWKTSEPASMLVGLG
ncbi:MAG: hypothetical protein HXY51_07455 [Nitrospirae bacterium]|nr:hypothetical protein [Nitrospirota bacterium]